MSDLIVCSDADLRQTLTEREVCDSVGPLLARTYPGYRWRVEAHGGIVDIRCEHTNARWGYTLIYDRSFSETDWRKKVLQAGGEILERFHLSRRGLSVPNFLDQPRDFAGLIHPDL